MPLTRGQRLRRLRKQKGVEQQVAASAIGISRPYLSLLERDEKGKNVDHLRATLEKAARYYDVNPAYLKAETPQEYIAEFIQGLGQEVMLSPGRRLSLVLEELQMRWGDEFARARVAEAMSTSSDALESFLTDQAEITDTMAQQVKSITGAPVEWLLLRPVTVDSQESEMQRIVQLAFDSGVKPTELEMLIRAWLIAKTTKPPSGS